MIGVLHAVIAAVDQTLVECLSSTSTTVSVQCPVGYLLLLGATVVYKSSTGCQSQTDTACSHSNYTATQLNRTCTTDYRHVLFLYTPYCIVSGLARLGGGLVHTFIGGPPTETKNRRMPK